MATKRSGVEVSSFPLLNSPLLDDRLEVREQRLVVPNSEHEFVVNVEGDTNKPAILTYHDIGLTHRASFEAHTHVCILLDPFLHSSSSCGLLESFCFYHITAPGQEAHARELPKTYVYPTMDQLSDHVEYVMHYFGLQSCVGLGVGLGANVLVRLARRRPRMLDGLIAINCNSQRAGWIEWAATKLNLRLMAHGQSGQVIDHLVCYHLGKFEKESASSRCASALRPYLAVSTGSAHNLGLLMESYVQRTDLGLRREMAHNGKPLFGATRSLVTPVLNMVGDRSPHLDATITFNGRLQPNKCTWMKVDECAMVLQEQKAVAARAIKLFLQGLGYKVS